MGSLVPVALVLALVTGDPGGEGLGHDRRGGVGRPHAVAENDRTWRDANSCGINALYMMLRLRGLNVDYRTVDSLLPVARDGTGLADLRRCSDSLGLRTVIVKATPRDLRGVLLPAIAHAEEEGKGTGHYVVLTAASTDGLEMIDGTTAIVSVVPWEKFEKTWTGYLLVPSDAMPGGYSGMVCAAVVVLLAALALRRVLGSRRPLAILRVAPLALAALAAATSRGAAGESPRLDEVANTMARQWDKVTGLLVDYEESHKVLADDYAVKRYLLNVDVDEYINVFAYKLNKLYYKRLGADYETVIAPDVEPDYDVAYGGREVREFLEKQKKALGSPPPPPVTSGEGKVGQRRRIAVRSRLRIEAAFDGEKFRQMQPDGKAAVLGSGNFSSYSQNFRQDYLEQIGRPLAVPADRGFDGGSGRFPEAFKEAGGYEIRDGTEAADGFPCAVVERAGHEKLWLDPRTNYGIRKRELYDRPSGAIKERRTNRNFAEVAPGIWLPLAGRRESIAPPSAAEPYRGRPLYTSEYSVRSVRVNDVPDSLFTLHIASGTKVADASMLPDVAGKNQFIEYTMPSDAANLEATIQQTLRDREQRQSQARSRRLVILGIALAGAAAAGLIGLVLARRHRAGRRSAAYGEG